MSLDLIQWTAAAKSETKIAPPLNFYVLAWGWRCKTSHGWEVIAPGPELPLLKSWISKRQVPPSPSTLRSTNTKMLSGFGIISRYLGEASEACLQCTAQLLSQSGLKCLPLFWECCETSVIACMRRKHSRNGKVNEQNCATHLQRIGGYTERSPNAERIIIASRSSLDRFCKWC